MFHLLSGVFWEAQKSVDMQRKKKKKAEGPPDRRCCPLIVTCVVVVIIINNLYRAFPAGIQRHFMLEVIQILKSKDYIEKLSLQNPQSLKLINE